MPKQQQRDRVSYSLSSAVKDYGSGYTMQVSYSTDVQLNETPRKALKRAAAFVNVEIANRMEELTGADDDGE